jgi:hypothetical protein
MIITLSNKGTYDTDNPKQLKKLKAALRRLNAEKIEEIKVLIEKALIVTQADICIYDFINDDETPIRNFLQTYVPYAAKTEDSHYTYIKKMKCFYLLPSNQPKDYQPFALIDKLLYEKNKASDPSAWDKEPCLTLRRALNKFYPKSFKKGINYFTEKLKTNEVKEHTYFGDYLSDDSDSEAETAFQVKSSADRQHELEQAKATMARIKASKLLANLDVDGADTKFFDFERLKIQRAKDFDANQSRLDLRAINLRIQKGEELTQEFLSSLKSSFVVAQYRGVHYFTNLWDTAARREHRKLDEKGKPQFTRSIFVECKIESYRDYQMKIAADKRFEKKLINASEILQQNMLLMQHTDPVTYKGYTYLNLLYLLQTWYSTNYDNMPKQLRQDFTEAKSFFKDFLANEHRPFLSTSDAPFHALRYALGVKYYQSHQHERLRPRWLITGKAERPYSGKVYISLHPLNDYTERNPSHLTTLFKHGLVYMSNIIAAERETSFLGFMPANRIVYEHIAKYPSFIGDYKEIYADKYGLDEANYNKFKTGFAEHPPHSNKRRHLIRQLGEYLAAYHEAKMIDKARQIAESKIQILIYRDDNGTFSFDPPRTPSTSVKELRSIIKGHREVYKALASDNKPIIRKLSRKNANKTLLELGKKKSALNTYNFRLFQSKNAYTKKEKLKPVQVVTAMSANVYSENKC